MEIQAKGKERLGFRTEVSYTHRSRVRRTGGGQQPCPRSQRLSHAEQGLINTCASRPEKPRGQANGTHTLQGAHAQRVCTSTWARSRQRAQGSRAPCGCVETPRRQNAVQGGPQTRDPHASSSLQLLVCLASLWRGQEDHLRPCPTRRRSPCLEVLMWVPLLVSTDMRPQGPSPGLAGSGATPLSTANGLVSSACGFWLFHEAAFSLRLWRPLDMSE